MRAYHLGLPFADVVFGNSVSSHEDRSAAGLVYEGLVESASKGQRKPPIGPEPLQKRLHEAADGERIAPDFRVKQQVSLVVWLFHDLPLETEGLLGGRFPFA